MKNTTKVVLGLAVFAAPMLMILATPSVQAQNAPAGSGNICLNTDDIRTTQTKDARTILFRMRDGSVWQNDLAAPCPELVLHGTGFSTQVHGDRICANQQHITVNATGAVCRLGTFRRVN